MLKAELLEIISNGENSGVEFKRDDIRPEQLARELAAMANFQGGRVFLGVEDDGTISGLQRENTQERVLNIFRDKIFPQIIPYYEEIAVGDKKVAVVTVASGLSKPYTVKHNGREDIYIRLGDRSELATRQQQLRLFESGGLLHVETLPVPGSSFTNLDTARLENYLRDIIRDPEIPSSDDEWRERLLGLGLMATDSLGNVVCSLAGILCFGISPRRFLPQAGLRAMVFDGDDKEYEARLDVVLDAPLVGRWNRDEKGVRQHIDDGLIEKFVAAVTPFISREPDGIDENFRRERIWIYPQEAVREAVVNALAHRDWTRAVDIEIVVYGDRMEITSPGRLPNSMTVTKMIAGQRSPRNPIIMEILRDYAYVDARGMGVRTKIIPLMRKQNGAEPIFEATDDYLRTVLPAAK